jgi:phosphatidylinositol alpha-1,6-mannosyltransferase
MSADAGRRVLATPPLGERGGGIGQVSAMLWTVMRRAWPESAELVTMESTERPMGRLPAKLRFGAAIGARQASGAAQWVLFAHLGLARAQRVIPPRFRAPYAVFLHGIESWAALDPADVAVVNAAAVRIANSEYTAARVHRANPAIAEIDVCPLALDPARMPPPPDPARVRPSAPPAALIVGRMSAAERYKGHEQLIDVWPAVVSAIPDARLVIAGDGDDRPRLQARAARSTAAAAIRFTGFLDAPALADAYAAAQVFAMPSRGEGFGLVYLEAMAHGLPCIGSVHDAAREVVVDGETGLLVNPGDEAALASALVTLLGNRARAQAYGRAGRARLCAHFTFARFERRILASLQRAFERPEVVGGVVPGESVR